MGANDMIAEYKRRITVYEDEEAYKQLFFLLFEPLRQFSFSIVKSKENAEDIVSDTFIDLWARRLELDKIEDLRAYLFIAVRNRSFRRIKQHRNTISLDEIEVEMCSHYPGPDDFTIGNELHFKIQQAIEQLPPRNKLIFKLAKEDKLKYKDIASLLSISVKTIDAQLSTALRKIATAIHQVAKRKS